MRLYLLPNLLTCGNLGAGFYAILGALNMNFQPAAIAILVAIVLDMLDGRLARALKTTSAFGIQLDSLADLVSFGVAPAVLVYQVALYDLGRTGALIAFSFLLAAALRLARFNVKAAERVLPAMAGEAPSTTGAADAFQGLPSPAAAGIVAALVLTCIAYGELGLGAEHTRHTIGMMKRTMPFVVTAIPVVVLVAAGLMVSSVGYASFKRATLRRRAPFRVFVLILTAGLLIWRYPESSLLVLSTLYLLSGLTGVVWRAYRMRRAIRLERRAVEVQS